ncbi:hypothetical protein JOD54_005936 [Actinokineospora baliensis]|uniref:hypothetical protein n=1 Tax=Actinokineospora baliensis TaxID=547056 RepID=UPI00195C1156|nr:hypothetical protein [Actinokineospora baliensis]MBM7775732.1 hypothetical protein [Actinokineospora baliensis]
MIGDSVPRRAMRRAALSLTTLLSLFAILTPQAGATTQDVDPCAGRSKGYPLLTIPASDTDGLAMDVSLKCGEQLGPGYRWGLRHIVANHARLLAPTDWADLQRCVELLATNWDGALDSGTQILLHRTARDGIVWQMWVWDTSSQRGVATIFATDAQHSDRPWDSCL